MVLKPSLSMMPVNIAISVAPCFDIPMLIRQLYLVYFRTRCFRVRAAPCHAASGRAAPCHTAPCHAASGRYSTGRYLSMRLIDLIDKSVGDRDHLDDNYHDFDDDYDDDDAELSTGRMDPRVGSGRVTILPDFGGSGQHFGFYSFLLIISWYLNRYESSNTTFGLINFLRYLIYITIK